MKKKIKTKNLTVKNPQTLSATKKRELKKAVKKVIKEYGETLKLLAKT